MPTIHHHRLGDGEPVLLIHGIGHHGPAWGRVPALLAGSGYQVWTLDLPGHGRSDPVTDLSACTLERVCEQIEEFLAAHSVVNPHVVGNSLGGAIAIALARRGSVRSALALAPAGHYRWWDLAISLAQLGFLKSAAHLPLPVLRATSATGWMRRLAMWPLYVHTERVTAEQMYADAVNMRRSTAFWGWIRQLARQRDDSPVEAPLCIAWGAQDRLLLPVQADRARRVHPSAEHRRIPEAGHCPQHDQPEAVAALIARFTADQPSTVPPATGQVSSAQQAPAQDPR